MSGPSRVAKWLVVVVLAALQAACGGDSKEDSTNTGPVGPELGDPIDVVANEQWTWVPIEGSQCSDGTQAGIGVNFTGQSRDLVIWFQGNGVCYDEVSCNTLFPHLLGGMGPDPLNRLWWGTSFTGALGIFDRNDTTNPLRASNYIAFPHCGVDGHSADKESTYGANTYQQRGYSNVTKALPRIWATFQDATRVVVAGYSAGGIGAKSNYHQIAVGFEALGMPPPFLIDDAGPILRPPYANANATTKLRTGWGTDRTIEPWCPDCATDGYHMGYKTLAELHPGLRSSVICAYGDGVVSALYTMLNGEPFDGARMEAGLRDLESWTAGYQAEVAPSAHRMFFYGGNAHGALVTAPLALTPGGLATFLSDQLSGSAGWATVKP